MSLSINDIIKDGLRINHVLQYLYLARKNFDSDNLRINPLGSVVVRKLVSKSPSIALCTSLLATACLFAYSSDGGGYQDVMLIVPV